MIQSCRGNTPAIHPTARVAENATLIGDVAVEQDASIWFGAVLRGDDGRIRIGARSNIQDNAVLHCDPDLPMDVGRDVTVGHAAILHSCTVEDGCLVGMGAVLLDGCVVGQGSIVAAGALVPPGKIIPPGSMVMGVPGRVVRPVTEAERLETLAGAEHYVQLGRQALPPAREE